ncbi:MAG: hypothetical protein HY023_08740 [Chloroflexi bacterium]|nr:hypothetical protein [Chloroflexota bacterium]
MTLKTLFTINAVVAVVFGIAFAVAPVPLMSLYGGALTPAGTVVAQLFGAALVGFAVISWLARGAAYSDAVRAIVVGFVAGDVVGFVLSLLGQLSGAVNALGWSTVVLYLLLAVGFGYFEFVKKPVTA